MSRFRVAARLAGLVMVCSLLATGAFAQQTVGLFKNEPGTAEGYLLACPNGGTAYLIDRNGYEVHRWETGKPLGTACYLLPDGNLLRSTREPADPNFDGFNGGWGLLEEYDWDGTLVWSYRINDPLNYAHHDFTRLPNGNTLILVWNWRSDDEAIQAGRDPATISNSALVPDKIVEIQKTGLTTGNVVWEWDVWDHLIQDFDPTKDNFGVVEDHPERININQPTSLADDWTHANGMFYNALFEQIIISVREFSEFWIIDHSTTTAQAAGSTGGNYGKGGDLLYRWGNPQTYKRGTELDRELENQHDAHWIAAGIPEDGQIIVYNNGTVKGFSTVDEVDIPFDEFGAFPDPGPTDPWSPLEPTRRYTANPPTSFFSPIISGADRLPNGNTIITEGVQGRVFEVTPAGETVWQWINPIGTNGVPLAQGDTPTPLGITTEIGLFKNRKYPPDYPGLLGRDLSPQSPLAVFTPPAPAPDGSGSTSALTASKVSDTEIEVQWDAGSCTAAANYNLVFGSLSAVDAYEVQGAECGLGTTGTYAWSSVPGGSLYYLIVGVDSTGVYESSWGRNSAGQERRGPYQASFTCDATTKVVDVTCP